MVYIRLCNICKISISVDKNLCLDCMEAISNYAMEGRPINKERIKKDVETKRIEEARREIEKKLESLFVCPQCGHKL